MKHATSLTLALAAVLALLWAGVACSPQKLAISPEVAGSDEQLYQLGEAQVKKDPDKARIYLRQVILWHDYDCMPFVEIWADRGRIMAPYGIGERV